MTPPLERRLTISYGRLAILFLVLNTLSALLFIFTVRKPVYDDSRNITDVLRYAHEGVTLQSIGQHVNPTGPSSFIWMAGGVRILDGNEIRAARLAVLASWLILGCGMLAAARRSESPELWHASLLVTLVFPHTMTTTATLMTEGPALLAAMFGTIGWIYCTSEREMTAGRAAMALLSGLALGLAVTCRQYYIALLPAAGLVALWQFRRTSERKASWILVVLGSLLMAAGPILLLIFVWKGLSSPGMAAGTSYTRWKAAVGANGVRPLCALFSLAAWMAPFTFPAMSRLCGRARVMAVMASLVVGLIAGRFRDVLLQPGPLNSLAQVLRHVRSGEFLIVAGLAAIGLYNGIAFITVLWDQRNQTGWTPALLFSVFVLIFFIAEQFAIGGNIPFYDRYTLQVAPFVGIIAFRVAPDLTRWRIAIFAALNLFSHALLWRNTFGS